jgi:hypothetical protein
VTHFVDLTFHDYGTSDVAALQSIERHPGWAVVDGWPSVWIVEAVASGTSGSTSGSTSASVAEFEAEIEQEFVRYVRSGH